MSSKRGHHSIQILLQVPPSTGPPPPPPPPQPPLKRASLKKPSSFYLSGEQRENYLKICVPLYNAALRGDWYAAERIIRDYPKVINMSITRREDTILHIVALTKHTHFAKKLVKKMNVIDLELQNKEGETALWLALSSSVEMVDVLLKRNTSLLKIRTKGDLPFLCAIQSGDRRMVSHIYSKTNLSDEIWNQSDKKRVLNCCIAYGAFDIALKIYEHSVNEGILAVDMDVLRHLAINPSAFSGTRYANTICIRVLRYLANNPSAFAGTRYTDTISALLVPVDHSKGADIVRIIWGQILKQDHEDILKLIAGDPTVEHVEDSDYGYPRSVDRITYPNRLLFTSARSGNYKFIIEILRLYPDITWDRDDNKHTIFHVAVLHRHENVYNILYDLGSKKLRMIDNNGNNILHLAAKKPSQSTLDIVPGAVLQMQRELLWFKEIKKRVSSVDETRKNKQGKTPQELFTDEHAELVKKGEVSTKETISVNMVVAALIVTVAFSAACTWPGNYNVNGIPMKQLDVFVVTNAISFFVPYLCSCTFQP